MVLKAILETIGVFALACLFAYAGFKITQRKSKAWIVSFCITFPLVFLVILMNRTPVIFYKSGLSWIGEGRNEYIMMAVCMPFIFGLLVPRLPITRQKVVVGIFALLGTVYFVIPPFLDPVILYAQMKDSKTWIEDGVCIQNTSYTCGAASAVTALRQFGIEADEREIAMASYTSRIWGTTQYSLADAIEKMYRDKGIACEVDIFEDISKLKDCCPVIMIVKYRPLMDHFVTVLEADDTTVLIGDPLSGKERLTHKQFEDKSRQIGIVVRKE